MNLAGALLIVSGAYYLGVAAAKRESERLILVEALISLFSYMQRRILAERLPLIRIFREFTNEHLEKTGFLPTLRLGRSKIEQVWQTAVSRLLIEKSLRQELLLFGVGLGALPLERQLARIDSCLSLLSSEKARLISELPKKKKSIKTVYLLIGLTVSIILL